MKRVSVVVSMTVPDQATRTEIKEHVRDAVSCWGGQYEPTHTHPLFPPNIKKLTVSKIHAGTVSVTGEER